MLIVGRGRRRRRHRILHTVIGDQHSSSGVGQLHYNPDIGNMAKVSTTFKRYDNNQHLKYWTVIASSALIVLMTMETNCTELHPAWRSGSGTLRNIRHLPCVSRRTGETGLCMFAYTCARENGTHLGTCIDRFYFGSCCKINSNSDPDLVDPIMNNHLPNNKDEMMGGPSSSIRTPPYHRPLPPGIPEVSVVDTSSTISLPVSISSVSRPPLSVVSIPSSPSTGASNELYTTVFGSTKFSPSYTASSPASYDTTPSASRTPVVNFTLLQSYSPPTTTHVTTPPMLFSTSMVSTVFQSGTHKPLPSSAFQTTSYSKPATPAKPTFKPGVKPKPTAGPGKPLSVKPKPTKPQNRPQSAYYTSTESPFANKTTIYSSTNGFSSKPLYTTESNSVPTKTTPRPSSQGIPTPVPFFTQSSKKPTKYPKPSTPYTTTPLSTTYVKIPASTLSQSNRPPTTPSTTLSSFSSSSSYFSSTTANISIQQNVKFNSSTDDNEITEKPLKPWPASPSSSTTFISRPWTTTSTTSSTPSQPALVTWTTIDEIPAAIVPAGIIPPDRTKPTRPPAKPTSTKPTTPMSSTYSKPLTSSTSKPIVRPNPAKPDFEDNYRPPMTTISSSPGTPPPPGWVEVPTITSRPGPPILSHTTMAPATEAGEDMTIFTQSKPSQTSSSTTPITSPVPTETTPIPPIESNEIDSSGINMSDYRAVCGRRMFPTARIVGGEKATFGKWPWQISLRQWRTSTYLHKCGAALFNENWAVTAAHCVENVPPSDLLLRLGEYDLSIEDEPYGFQERRVQIVASHPQFDPRTFEYDLALLRFYEPVKFQPNIIPICVPEDDINFVGSQAFVTGWGRLYEDGPLPSILQEVSVPVINNSVCENMYQAAGYIEHIPNIFICAGWKKGGFDSCEGDSGGPMVIQRPDKRWLLAGIISWGIGCAEPNQPGVYTRISEFRDWINQILQF